MNVLCSIPKYQNMMKKTINLSVKRETVSKLNSFNFAQVMGGTAEEVSVENLPTITPPKISVNTYLCSQCDNA